MLIRTPAVRTLRAELLKSEILKLRSQISSQSIPGSQSFDLLAAGAGAA